MVNDFWDQAFCDRGEKNPVTMELKVVLFLFLMVHEADYGWNISSKFKEAIKTGKWTDRRGLGDLKYENKVEAALKQMEQLGLIFKYSDLKKQIQLSYFYSSKLEAEVRKNPRRNYYSINPAVFIGIAIPTETRVAIYYDDNSPEWNVINDSLRFIQDYRKDDLEVIELINNISKFDYLTIPITMSNIFEGATLHPPFCEGSDAGHKTEVSRSFFNNKEKLERLLDKYKPKRTFDRFWQFHSNFRRLIDELVLREVFFERGYQKII
jgi:hypothetical protein